MPSKNAIKTYAPHQYYHVYNRGVEKRNVFIDKQDYAMFLSLLKRYLSTSNQIDAYGRSYHSLNSSVRLVSFCLMPNHFHLLIYQTEKTGMQQLLHRVTTTYTGYFNKKYERVGALFQGVYKASMIKSETYLQHISRYIHTNPDQYRTWEWSSLPYWLNEKQADWVHPTQTYEMNPSKYLTFLDDWRDAK